jgi:hypothetical protein
LHHRASGAEKAIREAGAALNTEHHANTSIRHARRLARTGTGPG